MRKLILFIATLLLGSATVVGQVAATDTKRVSGALCLPQNGDRGSIEYDLGRAINSAATSRTLVCPIIRDDVTNNLSSAKVMVTASNSSDVSCALRCCDSYGSSCAQGSGSATAGDGDTLLTFSGVDSDPDGPCWIYCVFSNTGEDGRLRWYEYVDAN